MNIYFSGIGGVGLGPLAEIALDAGHVVQGSDPDQGLMTIQLRVRGVTISQDQSGGFLRSAHAENAIDWFVYTSALPDNHPELLCAKQLGIKISKRDELLAHIIQEKNLKLIAVAGTHGKTTTTGMAVWALKELGIPLSYAIGTTLSWGPSGIFDPSSEYFVYECDEFDRNFLHFYPNLSIITAIDYDHPDTYPSEGDYTSAFRQFIEQSMASIMWQSDADYVATHQPSTWCLQRDEVMSLSLTGSHNRRNATLVLKALERLGIGSAVANQDAISTFPGTDRRFEKLADNLYSDYGHHPVEIRATLELARELNNDVMLVYQPHQNVRQHEIRDQYTDCFIDARSIYWLPTYLSREDPKLAVLTPQELTQNIVNKNSLHLADLNDQLWQAITDARQRGTLVLCMGAGSVDNWLRQQLSSES